MNLIKVNNNDYINADLIERVFVKDVVSETGEALQQQLYVRVSGENIVVSDMFRRDFLFMLFKSSNDHKQFVSL